MAPSDVSGWLALIASELEMAAARLKALNASDAALARAFDEA